jgi:hypothetical protein
MFRTDQILNSTDLLKHFRKVAKLLTNTSEPILVMPKSGAPLVLINAEAFEAMVLKGINVPDFDIEEVP